MKISILDQSPVMTGCTANEALEASVDLARLGERLGYERYWIAEHHDMKMLASSVPEVMLSYIGAHTSQIRIGSGAVLLPHYKPYKVAETFNLLETLFPNRIDLGIGRAPGGSAEAAIALSGNFLENVKKMPEKLNELLHFLYNDFPLNSTFGKIQALPRPLCSPKVWILGTSEKSAIQAAKNGMGYAFGHFMSGKNGQGIVDTYFEKFKPSKVLDQPYCVVTVDVICAETNKEAEKLAFQSILSKFKNSHGEKLTSEDEGKVEEIRDKMIVGNPEEVRKQLQAIKNKYKVDEIMIVTITDSYYTRRKSYELIANELL